MRSVVFVTPFPGKAMEYTRIVRHPTITETIAIEYR